MNLAEFSFVNQQLAGMLKSGLPLEGALRQLAGTIQRGALRHELAALEADLGRGTPLREALAARRLPEFYVQMLQIGAQSNDLPGVLTMLGDYYHRLHLAWTRLKGLLVYPLIVLLTSFSVSVLVAVVYQRIATDTMESYRDLMPGQPGPPVSVLVLALWLPTALLGLLCVLVAVALLVPPLRRRLRWKFPGFKEAGLSQMASAFALMLENGCPFNQALELVCKLEGESPMKADLAQWQARHAAGHRRFNELAEGGRTVPALFVWLVAGSGENWAAGFRQAAQLYFERTVHRVEMMLYSVLPVSVLLLGCLILAQALPILGAFARMMRMLSSMGDGG